MKALYINPEKQKEYFKRKKYDSKEMKKCIKTDQHH